MTVAFTLKLKNQPLRHTYVSHYDFLRVPQTLFFLSNESGEVTVTNVGNATVTLDPTGPTGSIKVRVHAQNTVVRVLDGALPVPLEVSQEFTVSNGGTININTAAEQQDHFGVMAACLDAYETVFEQFRPFNRSNRRNFPFGRANTLAATRDRLPRIEVSFPDNSVAPLTFVEPVSVGTGYPLIHLKQDAIASIPHELAHALYFALMPVQTRLSVETQYLAWLTSQVASGLPPFHNTRLATTPFIAWIESFGLFAERFFRFAKQHTGLSGVDLRQAFFRDQLSAGSNRVGSLDANGNVVPAPGCTGDNVEGAVFGAIFVDLARRVGLREAVGLFFDSAEHSVLKFDDYRNFVINETDHDSDIGSVANTWRL